MVAGVRRGSSQQAVARRFGVSVSVVQHWLARAGAERLDRVDWSDRRARGHAAVNRTPLRIEERVLAVRRELKHESLLGEYGAQAIHDTLVARGERVPSRRTVGRILARHGVLDRHTRRRSAPPPPGWHLPAAARGEAEADLFDVVEDLKLAGGPLVDVLTAISLHGGLPAAWPLAQATTSAILPRLMGHWRTHGRPTFAQFDNDTRFQGPHQHRDVIGRVSRLCLQLGITPVFVPPRELGLQNAIEHFNGLFRAKVWNRVHFRSLPAFARHSLRYTAALHERRRLRSAAAPARTPWPTDWHFDPDQSPAGQLVYIRRTSAGGEAFLLGRRWPIDPHWAHRLVRIEIDLDQGALRAYALRRSAPTEQPLLMHMPYEPRRR